MNGINDVMSKVLLSGKTLREVGFPERWKYNPVMCWWETRHSADGMKEIDLKTKQVIRVMPLRIMDEQLTMLGVGRK